jgi:hypothetical protein
MEHFFSRFISIRNATIGNRAILDVHTIADLNPVARRLKPAMDVIAGTGISRGSSGPAPCLTALPAT